ncbi:MAG TPA: tetratricopeptide repeat protein, partial [Firmicutes bacterium]|nr:tetratricopeptide repeat protein [Bacillota bacterium]
AYMAVLFAVFYGRKFFTENKIFVFSAAAFIIILGLIFSVPNPLNKNPMANRLKDAFNLKSDSAAVRLFYWEAALEMAKANPLLGTGIGGFSLNSSFYQKKVYDRWLTKAPALAGMVHPHVELYTHNDYLQSLAETGFPGAGLFLWLCASALLFPVFSARRENSITGKNLLLACSVAIAAFLINAALNFPWRVVPTLILLWSIFAVYSLTERTRIIKIRGIFLSEPVIYAALIGAVIFTSMQFMSFSANLGIKRGQALFAAAQYEEARKTFDKAVASNPRGTDTIELVLYTGNAYNALKNIDKAVEFYNRGLLMFPYFIESHYNVGNVYMNNGMTEKAVEEYQKVLSLNPKFTGALNNLGNIYFNRNKFNKAIDMYISALSYTPGLADTRYNLGAAYFRIGKYQDAYRELKKTLEYDPGYALAKEWVSKLEASGLLKTGK